MISIQQMHYILVLSEEQHFQRASERCFVTQPTLSMQLKKAEDTLGNLVFDRSKTPLELTAFGKSLIPLIRETLNEYSKITDLVEKTKGVYKEEVRIGIIPTVSCYMLPDLFGEWEKSLKDVQLVIQELKTEEILHAFEMKKLDIGILAGPVYDERLRVVPLYKERIKAYFPKGKTEKILIEELADEHPWLLTSGNCLRTQMMNFCELKESASKAWDYEGGSIDLLERMVKLNGGYTLVPEHYIRTKSKDYHSIESNAGEVPVREIIALSSNRTSKWETIEKFVRSIQLKYNKEHNGNDNFKVLNWK